MSGFYCLFKIFICRIDTSHGSLTGGILLVLMICICTIFLSWPCIRFGSQVVMIFSLGGQYILTPRKRISSCLLAIKLVFTFLFRRGLVSVFHLISVENGLRRWSQRHLLNLCQMNVSLRSLEGCLLARIGVHVLQYPNDGLCFWAIFVRMKSAKVR